MKKLFLMLLALTCGLSLWAEVRKDFPAHWGQPPAIQTRDYVELPGGYGNGSSTLRKWIEANLTKDQASQVASPASVPLYANDFAKAEVGKLPEDMMVLGGEFVVEREGTNQFLKLPGAPLDSFAVQFGPAQQENVTVAARIFGTSKGRRAPTFGVGLGGVSGWKLQVAPGKKALELVRDQELKAAVALDWQSGTWTQLQLTVRKVKDGAWRIEGKAWRDGAAEPATAQISFEEAEEPVAGRASILGSPFAGTPVWFDELRVTSATAQGANAAR